VDNLRWRDFTVSGQVRFADGTQGSAELPAPAEQIGARIVLRGKRVPFDEARNPGEPSAREIASERGVSWRIARARVMSREPPDLGDIGLYCARLRAWASARVHGRFSEPEATILAGAMWGERGPLAPDLRAEFQETGTVHVLEVTPRFLDRLCSYFEGLLLAPGGRRAVAEA
jgi:predicted membrane metal-binding protein